MVSWVWVLAAHHPWIPDRGRGRRVGEPGKTFEGEPGKTIEGESGTTGVGVNSLADYWLCNDAGAVCLLTMGVSGGLV